ncbi:MAG: alpha/beta hydrolase [Patescibacteria group bacterium]|nr:alpha/beta hydrolase [Patescibacteria group bacterium]MDZ4229188.1 alpha/beta hydrolase [Patescibacteria group bacterium]
MVVPKVKAGFADLPLTRLHFATAGDGQPLIMVPATISELDSWQGLIQFMALRFKVYFFELPGHGQSTAFKSGFSTDQVAETVADWTKQMGLNRFSLMGFSFGGILAIKTLARLTAQIDRMILLSPLVTNQALLFSRLRQEVLKLTGQAMQAVAMQSLLLKTAHNQRLVNLLIKLLTRLGHVETGGPRLAGLHAKLLRLPAATLDVLVNEIKEILNFNPQMPPFPQPCSFAMSINDPLLDFTTTENWLKAHFPRLSTQKFTFPYHQPPQPLRFDELVAQYQPFLDLIHD